MFHYNNKRSIGHKVETIIKAKGYTIEHLPPGLLEINGPTERSRGIVVYTTRILINDIELPYTLWPEAIYAVVYILNRTLTQINSN